MRLPWTKEATGRGRVRRAVLALALPVVAASLLERAVAIVDVFLVGGLGAAAIAAVGASQLLVFMAISVVAGLPAGSIVVVSQLWGAGRRAEVSTGARRAVSVAMIAGVLVGTCGVWWGGTAVEFIGASPGVVELSRTYIRIVFAAFPFLLLVSVLSGILQGTGDTKTPWMVSALMNVIHVGIAYPLVYGEWGMPRWELRGAGVAVAVSQAVGAGCLLVVAHRRGLLMRGVGTPFLRAVVRVGLPVSVDRSLQQAAQFLYAMIVLSYGTAAYAAHQVGVAIEALSFLPGLGFALAAETSFGRSLGANTLARARMQSLEANKLALMVMSVMGVVFAVAPYGLLHLFSNDADVIALGTRFLHVVALLQIPLAITLVLSGVLRAAGDTRFLLLSSLIGSWGVRVPLAALMAYGLGWSLTAVWSVMLVDWTVRMVLLIARYRSGAWLGRRVLWSDGSH